VKHIQSIDDLQPDPKNANLGTEHGRGVLEQSLREYGAGRSILVDKNSTINGGQVTEEQVIIDAKTGEIIEAGDAWERHQRIVALRVGIQQGFLELGHELYDFRLAKQWKELGHPTFNSYIADPDVDLGRMTAFRLMTVYGCYALNLQVTPVLLLEAGYSKLYMLCPYMTSENVREWVDRAGTLSRSDLTKAIKEELKRPPPPLPSGKYRVLYADPPWKYGDILPPGYGAATHHYETMSNEELCDMGDEIKELLGPDAVLFLWTTSPMLERAFEVMHAWGFSYKTSFVWDKVEHNFGFYNSVRHELLLIGGRGHSTPDDTELCDSVITLARSEVHSQKPKLFRDMIDQLYTWGPRLELFARESAEGWESWGDEANG